MSNIEQQFQVMTTEELMNINGGSKGVCKFIMAGANGYSCRYPNGEWSYIVTKGPLEATLGVISNGWISSLGGGYFHQGH